MQESGQIDGRRLALSGVPLPQAETISAGDRLMYLGRFTLGQFAPLAVLTLGDGYAPVWPALPPVYTIYDNTGARVASGKMPPADLGKLTGSFAYLLRLGSTYSAGQYVVVFDWTSTTARRAVNRFEVVGGGNANGGVISMHAYRRPHADFLVQKLDSLQRAIRRNPE